MHVLVSGAAGHVARILLPLLCNDREFDRVVGIDTAPIHFHHRKLRILRSDIASSAAAAAVREVDAVVELASSLQPNSHRGGQTADADVNGIRTLLSAAGDAGVSQIVFLSSAAVYGEGNNLSEEARIQPPGRCAYAQYMAQCERWVEAQLPRAVRLRPHIILGPHVPPPLKLLFGVRVYPRLPDPPPLLQCVHELDVANAVRRTLVLCKGGAYNLAAHQSFSLPALVKSRHAHAIGLPPGVVQPALWLVRHSLRWKAEPLWRGWWQRHLTLDCGRAESELGWRPQFDDWRAIVAATFAPY